MPVRVLSPSDERFIRRNCKKLSSRDIAKKLNVPRGTISSFYRREGIKIPRSLKLLWQSQALRNKYKSVVHPEDPLIKELYLLLPEKTLADILGRSGTFVHDRIKNWG